MFVLNLSSTALYLFVQSKKSNFLIFFYQPNRTYLVYILKNCETCRDAGNIYSKNQENRY